MFEYAGQDTATVHISVNDGEPIENEIIYGTIKGLKIDRETGENIAGALFGMFKAEEKELSEKLQFSPLNQTRAVFLNLPMFLMANTLSVS